MATKTPEGYLTKNEAAAAIGHSPQYLMVLSGRGDFVEPLRITKNDIAHARVYFKKDEIDAWLRKRKRRGTVNVDALGKLLSEMMCQIDRLEAKVAQLEGAA